MKIYLDTCCYNRPFDDQGQMKIRLESISKLFIQSKIRENVFELVWSFMLDLENDENPNFDSKENIQGWKDTSKEFCDFHEDIREKANSIEKYGIKSKDALHIACAISSNCDFFITTDKVVLNKNNKINELEIINPIDFVRLWSENNED
ncbi:MAG: PIN domain-containing protein [Methanobrevibacter sp.]|jgi:predicted nucleic acid-binding protein|nr:PIN domain-containing protein [Methanobrevibacter sp.]